MNFRFNIHKNKSNKKANRRRGCLCKVPIYTVMVSLVVLSFVILIMLGSNQSDKNRIFDSTYKMISDVEELHNVWYDASDSIPYAYPDSLNSIKNHHDEIVIYRQLPSDIKSDDRLLIRTSVAEVKIWVENSEIYSYSAESTKNEWIILKTWHSVLMKPEWANQKLTIEINTLDPLDNFVIRQAYIGNEYALRDYIFIHDAPSLFLASCLVFLGLNIVLTHIVSSIKAKKISEQIWFGGLLTSVGIWGISSRDFIQTSLPFSWIGHMVFLGSFLAIPMFYLAFVKYTTRGRFERLVNIGIFSSLAWAIVGMIMVFLGYQNYGLFIPTTLIIMIYSFVIHIARSLVTFSDNAYIRKYVNIYIFSIVLLLSSLCYEVGTYYIFGNTPSVGIFLITFVFALVYMTIDSVEVSEKNEGEKSLATKLINELVATAFSQIKPHFLYNTLTSIKSLIRTDPIEAYVMISDFSDYLRSNFDAMNQRGLIPIEEELEHIRVYMKIEKKRFGDRVRCIVDNRMSIFSIPALSLQPLVENAIKHGICAKVEGGTVVLRIYETPFNYCVEVRDDGVGFKTTDASKKEPGGLENAIFRLKNMINAEVSVSSEEQIGTNILIKIPKTKENNGI